MNNIDASTKVIRTVFIANKVYDLHFVKGNVKRSIPHRIIGIDVSTRLPCFQYDVTKEYGNQVWVAISGSKRKAINGWVYHAANESYLLELAQKSAEILHNGIYRQEG